MGKKQDKFTGQLYQLRHGLKLSEGTYVAINGPWDTYGVVLKAHKVDNNEHLHLIRGVAPQVGHKPAAQF